MQITHNTITISNTPIQICSLQTSTNIHAEISSVGAALVGWYLPDSFGNLDNVVLSFADPADYLHNSVFAGAVLGPNAGRLSNSILDIHKTRYHLTANDNSNNLHGGSRNLSFQNWTIAKCIQKQGYASVLLETTLPDTLDGFPGNRSFQAQYTLYENGSLELELSAATDAATYINLSNHTYFQLSGDFSQSALKQSLFISAEKYIANNSQHLPENILPVENSPFDFRTPTCILELIRRFPNDPQLANALGYNNGFLLNTGKTDAPAAILSDSVSGRTIRLHTDAPCLVLYSGGYLENGPAILNCQNKKIHLSPSCAIALEAQDFPDAPSNPLFSCKFLLPGQLWKRKIFWEFCPT
ncbi:MAG: aldose epimerase family protein [Bacillota bacterium]|nr:aldose epimerase family protein [Bacillota bacterium]